jgi:hypothetical protein
VIPIYLYPLIGTGALTLSALLFRMRKVAEAGAIMFAGLVVAHLVNPPAAGDGKLHAEPWPIYALIDWACMMALFSRRSLVTVVLGAGFGMSMIVHMGYGAHEIIHPVSDAYGDQLVEWMAQTSYWRNTFAISVIECVLLLGWFGDGLGPSKRLRGAVRRSQSGGRLRPAYGAWRAVLVWHRSRHGRDRQGDSQAVEQ